MIDMNTIWGGILPNLSDLDTLTTEKVKVAVFAELGKYDYTPKAEHTELVQYDDDKKGYTMFFVAKKVEGLSDKSLKYYKLIIDKFCQAIPKSLADYSSDDIRFYLAKRQIDSKCSFVTIDNERRVLNSFFEWLSSEGYINRNICSAIKNIKVPKRKKKAFSEIECTKIKQACFNLDGQSVELKRKRAVALTEFLFSTGCRVGEISALKRENVDVENREAIVYGKGNKERTVFLTPTCKMRLLEYWEIQGDEIYAFSPLKGNEHTEPLTTGNIEREIREIGNAAGVKNCHPHRFRRTAATLALRKGMSIFDVQRMLGHRNIETTKIYLDLDDTDLKYQHDKYF